ncbi:hypothetical protein EJ06DRAFT_567998 [Trichodelitschia bisporula]|uniref:Uncharacterized protein n=1 Tax=Trichodelitschia bisporula TaxID=703511 RepID=A0A6G1I7P6_9PEZI|nr:hypothetical protein EJ06DRAFT_567998 [Trichodelitschia bisporula]
MSTQSHLETQHVTRHDIHPSPVAPSPPPSQNTPGAHHEHETGDLRSDNGPYGRLASPQPELVLAGRKAAQLAQRSPIEWTRESGPAQGIPMQTPRRSPRGDFAPSGVIPAPRAGALGTGMGPADARGPGSPAGKGFSDVVRGVWGSSTHTVCPAEPVMQGQRWGALSRCMGMSRRQQTTPPARPGTQGPAPPPGRSAARPCGSAIWPEDLAIVLAQTALPQRGSNKTRT